MHNSWLNASADLARAQHLAQTVRRRHAAWYVCYLLLAAAGALLTLISASFLTNNTQQAVYGLGWCVCYGALSYYWSYQVQRQPVFRHGFRRVHFMFVAVYAVLYLIVGMVGGIWFPHNLAWWIPGAVAVTLPCFVTAYLVARR